jgi:hypothetical protein
VALSAGNGSFRLSVDAQSVAYLPDGLRVIRDAFGFCGCHCGAGDPTLLANPGRNVAERA